MPIISNFSIYPNSDATIQCTLVPVTSIGGWGITFQVTNRPGGISGLITSSTNSGYIGNVSGMTIVNSGQGIFSVRVSGGSMSGWNFGDYFYQFNRTGSGVSTLLSEGYILYSY